MTYLLGIDAGNTKTIALIARADGTIVGAGRTGCGDIYGARSATQAINAIDEAATQALAAAGVARAQVAAVVLSAAGADWPEDFDFLQEQWVTRGWPATAVYNDAIGALRAGSPDGTGVVVACGTGSATGARNANGDIWHSSFWQLTAGAGELGKRLLQAVYSAEMQMAPATALTDAVLAHFKFNTVEQLLHALTARNSAADFESRFIHPKTGGLARVLLDVADSGDGVARQIVQSHGEALGAHAVVAARKVGLLNSAMHLVLSGGVLRHPSVLLSNAIVDHVQGRVSQLQVTRGAFEPVLGALMLAIESLASPINPQIHQRLQASQPPETFFAT